MKINYKIFIRPLIVVAAIIAILYILIPPMGNGSISRIKIMANDCSALNQELLSEKYGTEYQKIEMDGHNIIAICQDSHSSWLGGNMVVVIDGDVFFHKRHVCGNRYFDTINSIYKSGVKSGSVKPGFEQFKSVLFTNVRLIPYSQIDAIKNDHG